LLGASAAVDICSINLRWKIENEGSISTSPVGQSRQYALALVFASLTYNRWTAICRGAVQKALTNSELPGITVQSRISRRSYGTEFWSKFVDGTHPEEDRVTDPITGVDKATRQIRWYMRKVHSLAQEKSYMLTMISRERTFLNRALYSCTGKKRLNNAT
jgi:hypothetical protein